MRWHCENDTRQLLDLHTLLDTPGTRDVDSNLQNVHGVDCVLECSWLAKELPTHRITAENSHFYLNVFCLAMVLNRKWWRKNVTIFDTYVCNIFCIPSGTADKIVSIGAAVPKIVSFCVVAGKTFINPLVC